MIEEKARVIAVDGNSITVESVIKSTCSTCQQVDSCGSGQIAKAIPHKTLTTKVQSNKHLLVGDEVILGIPEKDILQTAWQVYLWPIIGLIVFSGFGQWLLIHHWFRYEIIAIVLGILGGYTGFKLASFRQKQRNNENWLAPKLLSVLPKTIVVTQLSAK